MIKRLPRGITGFDAGAPSFSGAQFKATCYAAARTCAGEVLRVQLAGKRVAPNFHEVLIRLPTRTEAVRILCNVQHPILAIAAPATQEGDTSLEFVDCPELAGAFGGEFCVLTREEASTAVTGGLVADLSQGEMKQIRYWRPARVGDIVFNYWD